MSEKYDPDLIKLAVALTEITYEGFRDAQKSLGVRPPPDLRISLDDPRKVFDLMLDHLSKATK